MTPDDLRKLVLDGDVNGIVKAAASLDDAARRKLSKSTSDLNRELERGQFDNITTGSITITPAQAEKRRRKYIAAHVAVLAFCPLSKTKSIALWGISYEPELKEAVLQVLRDRKPDWLGDWLEHRLDQEFPAVTWDIVRRLMKEGLCRKPQGDGYIRLMASGLSHWHFRKDIPQPPPLSEQLKADPELLEDEIWRLFEVETMAFISDWIEKNPNIPESYESWPVALIKLSQSGDIDRIHLLRTSLAALSSGFKQNQLSGFRKLHERMKPTVGEIEVMQDDYIDLLSVRTGHVVSFALKMLAKLETKRKLDRVKFVENIGPVFAIATKTQPAGALKILKKILDADPERAGVVLEQVKEGLVHPSPDIQEQALSLLEAYRDEADEGTLKAVGEMTGHVAPALKRRVQKLSGDDAPSGEIADARDANEMHAEIIALAEKMGEEARKLVGLDGGADTTPGPLRYEMLDIHVLEDAEPVTPIAALDELIDAFSHAVENVDSAMEVERLLDGVSRLCAERPDNFTDRTAPLLKRVRNKQGSESVRGLTDGCGGVSLAMTDLVLCWLEGRLFKTANPYYFTSGEPFVFIGNRVREVTRRVARKQQAPLLAAPTHAHGWIDPCRLVDRVLKLQAERLDFPACDFTQALLRIAPDGREDALRKAAPVEGDAGRIMRWALGGEDGPGKGDQKAHVYWIAAARARSPQGDFTDDFKPLQLGNLMPDTVAPARYSWRAGVHTTEAYGNTYTHPKLFVDVSPDIGEEEEDSPALIRQAEKQKMKKAVKSMLKTAGGIVTGKTLINPKHIPTAALHRLTKHSWRYGDLHGAWLIESLGMIWPLNTDSHFVVASRMFMERFDDNASSTSPNHAFLEPFFETARPWTGMAQLALGIAMISKDADVNGLATDALIEGIEDGRADPGGLGRVLARLSSGGWFKANRLKDTLSGVAAVSELHEVFVCDLLQTYIEQVDEFPHAFYHVLELLLDMLATTGQAARPGVAGRLADIKGASKTAKLAAKIRKARATNSGYPLSAQMRLIETRIERARNLVV